jgi:hypothetical protein
MTAGRAKIRDLPPSMLALPGEKSLCAFVLLFPTMRANEIKRLLL